MKVKDLKEGMEDVTLEVEIDYIQRMKNDYGKDWAIVYVKDDTKDIKMIFNDKELEKAKEGSKVKVEHGFVNTHRKELQLNTTKEHPLVFLD